MEPEHLRMTECPGMTDEEAAVVLKWWCRQNNISYNDDMDNIEAAYRWYYKCEEEGDNYSPIYHLAMH